MANLTETIQKLIEADEETLARLSGLISAIRVSDPHFYRFRLLEKLYANRLEELKFLLAREQEQQVDLPD